MVIVETHVFTRQIQALLSEEEYARLQLTLALRPQAGLLIRGGGGLRKIRWAIQGRGKRGGIRVIYYWVVAEGRVLMLFAYDKREQGDLTPDQLKRLSKLVKEEFP